MADVIQNLAISGIAETGDFVLISLEFPAPVSVAAVDLTDITLSGSQVDDALAVELSPDGSTWTRLGNPLNIGDGVRTRRVGADPGQPVSATHARLVLLDAGRMSARNLTIAEIALQEEGELSDAIFRQFTHDDLDAYVLLFSSCNAEVYLEGVRQTSIPLPHTDSLLSRMDFAHRIDAMVVFHEKIAPWRIFRQGSAEDFDSRALVFDGMRQEQFEDTVYTNGVNERQQLEFSRIENGDTFNITLDGETTSTIADDGNDANRATNIKNALEALTFLEAGDITATADGDIVTIEFVGTAANRNWPELGPQVVQSSEGVITSATLREGEEGGEDIISDARGWPRCGLFAQQRLWMAGLFSRPQTVIASRLAEYFDFRAGGNRATDGIEFTIDTDDANGIRRMFYERHLILHTAANEHYCATDTFAADEPIPIVPISENGMQFNIPPLSIDRGVLYVQRGGNIVRELQFSDQARSFITVDISVRAPSLIKQPRRAMARRAGTNFKDNLYALCDEDGTVSTFISLREQEIAAWALDTTDGKFIAQGADTLGRVYSVVEREINGVMRRFVELADPTRVLDCSVKQDLTNATEITGLDHLEGKEIYATNGSDWDGPLTVSNGTVTPSRPLTGMYELGLLFKAEIETLDVRIETPRGPMMNARRKIATVEVSVIDSTVPEATVSGRTYPFPVRRSGAELASNGPLDKLITGSLRLEGFVGWDREATVTIARRLPGPFAMRALKLEVDY